MHVFLQFAEKFTVWDMTFFAISLVAIGTVVTSLFLDAGDHTDKFFPSEPADAGSPNFINALSHLVNAPVIHGGTATILNNGNEFVPSLLTDLQNAKNSINMTVFVWKKGIWSDRILQVLMEKQKAGVEVRILLDGLILRNVPHTQFQKLKNIGGKVQKFRTAAYGRLTRLHRRNHRRAIVIDGEIAYTGGMGIEDKWLGDGVSNHAWRDSMTRVTNPVASYIQSAFAQLWASAAGEVLVGPQFYPAEAPSTLTNELECINLVSSPENDTEPLPKFLWYSLACAKKAVYVTTPYFIPAKPVRTILMTLARKGIDVKILLPGSITDTKLVRWAGQYYYARMLKAGVKIYEYQASMLHNKILVVDSLWSVVGSANIDSRSLLLNEENVLGIVSSKFALSLQNAFEKDLEKSKQILPLHWQRRAWLHHMLEIACIPFAKQF